MYRQAPADFLGSGSTFHAFRFSGEDWWRLYLPLLLATVCVAWWECMPVYLGYALSMFALVAFLAVTRTQRSRLFERCIWAAFGLSLLAAEAGVAYATYHRAQSFLVCRFTEPGVAKVELHGEMPLRATVMEIADDYQIKNFLASHIDDGGRWYDLHQQVPLGDFGPRASKNFAVSSLNTHDGVTRYHILFLEKDDSFTEDYEALNQSGKQLQALRVVRYIRGVPKTIYEEADPEYLRNPLRRVDWTWVTQEPYTNRLSRP